uniref:Uncharacterized protein n=1 Tax=Caenorhabditis japonica TaxID=281687 RepID=A0A8R1DZS7_CAEJA
MIKPKTRTPVPKLGKVQKQKQVDAKLASAENVMAQFESGAVQATNKKKAVNKFNGHTVSETETVQKTNTLKPLVVTGGGGGASAQKRQLKKVLQQDGLLVKHQEGSKWYSYQVDHVHNESTEKLSAAEIQTLLEEGRNILAQDAALLQTRDKAENGSEASWLYQVISKGTAADKRTAMQLQMHKSPVHSLEYVEKLIASIRKQGTRDVVDVIRELLG